MISPQMIVYNWQKSKVICALIYTVVFLIFGYSTFVIHQILRRQTETFQIIHQSSTKIEQLTDQNQTKLILSPKVDLSFVASSRGKYFYPSSCTKAQSLSIKNMLHFKDKSSALTAGFIEYMGC